ncbi:hypothetical protein AAVH_11816 [Aphelenchoides avenae]|nr:hypothetical protein AAVH_11816 [Aphelenchus avenae]
MQGLPTTTEGIIESTKQSTTTTGRASAGSQSTPSKLTSIPTLASYPSSEPSPNTSSPGAKSDNVTLTNVSTHSGGTKGPPETTSTSANADKTNTSTAPPRTFTASTSATKQTENPATGTSYVCIALLVVGVVGTLVSTVIFVLALHGIICAPKQSLGPNVISYELDKTLL